MIDFRNITSHTSESDPSKIVLVRECPWCGKTHEITVDGQKFADGVAEYNRTGATIQVALPFLTPSEREFLMTGICDKCWEELA